MPFVDAAKHAMLDELATLITHLSLHDDYPGATGTNELSGDGYAREPVTWGAASGGSIDMVESPAIDVPAGDVAWYGLWSALTNGTFYGSVPAQGDSPGGYKALSVDDAGTDVIDSEAHGFSNADTVVVWGANLPAPLVEGTIYHVRDVATNSLKLAATAGGAAIDITALGDGSLQLIVVETFAAPGVYTVTDVDLDVNR